ncbi:hypothetical protein ABPG72_007443 [Tetrahymena utriculariae]
MEIYCCKDKKSEDFDQYKDLQSHKIEQEFENTIKKAIASQEKRKKNEQKSSDLQESMNLEEHISIEQIRQFENKDSRPHNDGYVPNDIKKNSGVTIATGFDLGQQNINGLVNEYKLSESLIKKLEPYIGIKGEDANKMLQKKKLTITDLEIKEIEEKVMMYNLKLLKKRVEQDGGNFEKMSKAVKTVLFSIQFQYGNFKKSFPNIWNYLIQGDLKAAADLLEKQTNFQRRRRAEATILRNALLIMEQSITKSQESKIKYQELLNSILQQEEIFNEPQRENNSDQNIQIKDKSGQNQRFENNQICDRSEVEKKTLHSQHRTNNNQKKEKVLQSQYNNQKDKEILHSSHQSDTLNSDDNQDHRAILLARMRTLLEIKDEKFRSIIFPQNRICPNCGKNHLLELQKQIDNDDHLKTNDIYASAKELMQKMKNDVWACLSNDFSINTGSNDGFIILYKIFNYLFGNYGFRKRSPQLI